MHHLFSSTVKILRSVESTDAQGIVGYDWQVSTASVKGRIDFMAIFQRNRRQIPVVEAGTVPDRRGMFICGPDVDIQPGDRIETISGPVTGIFSIEEHPDVAVGYTTASHLECELIEVAQSLI